MQNENRPHHEYMLQQGFSWLGSCRCEGILRNDYKRQRTIFSIYPENDFCKIKGTISRTPLNQLHELIESLT